MTLVGKKDIVERVSGRVDRLYSVLLCGAETLRRDVNGETLSH